MATSGQLENPNPTVYAVQSVEPRSRPPPVDPNAPEPFDSYEIFSLIRDINDPEHPLTLEQLHVATEEGITVDDAGNYIKVEFTPTIPHCSMATLIGLCIRVKLLRSLPERFKVDIKVTPKSHASEDAVNRQLNDKERVAAALENPALIQVVNKCLTPKEAY